MINNVVLIGRLTKDPEIYQSKDGGAIAKMNLAVDKGFGDNKKTNFIPVTTFGKNAEFCGNYLGKGRLIAVTGEISTGSYEKQDGTRVYTFEVIGLVESLDKAKAPTGTVPDGFKEVTSDCPF